MDNQNNSINPASPNVGNSGAADLAASVVPNEANANPQPKPVEPGTPVDNLVQDITPANTNQAATEPAQVSAPVASQPAPVPTQAPVQPVNNFSNPMPAPAPAPAPVQNTQPYGAPKKSHAGLIIGIVVLLLLVTGGIGGFLFYQQHEKTERVLADGLINLVTAKELTANSTYTITFNDEDIYDAMIESMNITTVSSFNEKYEASANAKVEIKLHNYDTMNAEAEVMEGENALYFRIVDTGNVPSVVSKVMGDKDEDKSANIRATLESAFTSIGDSWYEIPYNKIDESGKLKKSVDCVREKVKGITEGENWNKVLEVYQKNPFITVTEGAKIDKVNGYKKYPITIDEDKGEAFFDALEEQDFVKEISSCVETSRYKYNSPYVYEDNDEIDLDDDYDWDYDDDYDWDYDDDYADDDIWGDSVNNSIIAPSASKKEDTYSFTLGIKPWTHEVVWIGFEAEQFNYDDSSVKYNGEVNLSYTANVAAPGNTKSIDEFIESVEKSLTDGSKQSYYDEYCTKENNYSGHGTEEKCKEVVDEKFGDGASSSDIEDLLEGLIYTI